MNKIKHRQNDTFVIEHDGNPYHLTPTCGQKEMYPEILQQYKDNPDGFEEEYPPEPPSQETIQERERQVSINRIQTELNKIDAKSIRALRAISGGMGTDEEIQRLAELERQAKELRVELIEKTVVGG
ncbi:MAG: hypothetical protein LBH05_02800 [Deferribacteraceae bacterium]|jgi:hypothetical protein|nr:hypothetical protein [Deferribacteraceae bacterium]